MTDQPILTETTRDPWGTSDITTIWMCQPPDRGASFVVVRQVWNADYTERTIHEIRLA